MPRSQPKYFQDPLYGQIQVSSPRLLALIDSRPVQRLRLVRQLGTSYLTFLGAEHSRFAHSLGAMRLMGQVLDQLERDGELRLSPEQREIALAAALLHDIGHCAFSHTLEGSLIGDHETMTARLLREDPQLRAALGAKAGLIAGFFDGKVIPKGLGVIKDLVSSQLDVDRLDYLVRDAHSTGVSSGQVDLSRIIASLCVSKGRLAIRERGLLALEEYFLARYFMYWKVYYHKTSRGLELLLKAALGRAKSLHAQGRLDLASLSPALRAIFDKGEKAPLRAFLDHDDSDVLVALKQWQHGGDRVLALLSGRFLARQKYRLVREARTLDEEPTPRQRDKVREYFNKREKGSAAFLFIEDRLGGAPYDMDQPVWVVDERGKRDELSRRSKLVREIAGRMVHARYYCPPQDAPAVARLLGER